jgi:hypothetical protein
VLIAIYLHVLFAHQSDGGIHRQAQTPVTSINNTIPSTA